ncbi:MAG: GntR family transcriptional regulator [Pseudomonadota bacterium]|nr:GntR family transcriptional regulator [Pseudomonadota bacterium]
MQIKRGLLLSEQIFELLRWSIGTGELAGGTRLAQGELAERLGTSRFPVRDALKRLDRRPADQATGPTATPSLP